VLCVGRLVGQQGGKRLAIHRRSVCQRDLFVDLYRCRRERRAVRHRVGEIAGTHRQSEREPEYRQERCRFNLDLVFKQRDRVHRLRLLVGQQGRERLAVHRRSVCQRDLFVDL
jgi:hypothetical protein